MRVNAMKLSNHVAAICVHSPRFAVRAQLHLQTSRTFYQEYNSRCCDHSSRASLHKFLVTRQPGTLLQATCITTCDPNLSFNVQFYDRKPRNEGECASLMLHLDVVNRAKEVGKKLTRKSTRALGTDDPGAKDSVAATELPLQMKFCGTLSLREVAGQCSCWPVAVHETFLSKCYCMYVCQSSSGPRASTQQPMAKK